MNEWKVQSLIPSGSGVAVVHKQLSYEFGDRYNCQFVDPRRSTLPFGLRLAKSDVDIIHSIPDLGAQFFPKHTKNVVTFHNYYLDSFMIRSSSFFQRFYYANLLSKYVKSSVERAHLVTAVSGSTASLVRRDLGFRGSIEVINNGVDESVFMPKSNDQDGDCKVLFSGNFIRRKGVDILVDIAKRLPSDVRLVVAGAGEDVKGRFPSNIEFLGKVRHSDMPSIYRQCDILCFPTRREGMSLVLLEAMSSGLAVITSDIPSQAEILVKEKGGYLCDTEDVEQYVRYIRKLVNNKSMLSEMGDFNRELVLSKYRLSFAMAHYREVFEAVSR